jgi:hypothetical protein
MEPVAPIATRLARSIVRDYRHDSRVIDMITISFSVHFLILRLAAVFRRLHEKHIIARHDWTWPFLHMTELQEDWFWKSLDSGRAFGGYNVGG